MISVETETTVVSDHRSSQRVESTTNFITHQRHQLIITRETLLRKSRFGETASISNKHKFNVWRLGHLSSRSILFTHKLFIRKKFINEEVITGKSLKQRFE